MSCTIITTICIKRKIRVILLDNFIMDLQRLKYEFESERATISLEIQTNQFLANWLIKHISGTDKELGNYLCRTI